MNPLRVLAAGLAGICAGCGPVTSLDDQALEGAGQWCEPRPLEPGEVRARRIGCSDERIDGGSSQVGDWLLESAHVRMHVRDGHSALTQLDIAGGTALDLDRGDGVDLLDELVPATTHGPLVQATVTAWLDEDPASGSGLADDGHSAGLRVEGHTADGTAATFEYRLEPGAGAVSLVEVERATLVVAPGTEWVGSRGWLDGSTIAVDGSITDLGGWLEVEGPTLLATGSPAETAEALWPDGQQVDGVADGEWVEASVAGTVLARLPVVAGAFAGAVPAGATSLRATAAGRAAGPPSPPGRGLDLSAGRAGSLAVRVADDEGVDIPATLLWRSLPSHDDPAPRWTRWPLPAGGGIVPVGPGWGEGWVTAGPALEAAPVHRTDVSGVVDVSVILPAAVTPAVLADLRRPAWPDPSERRTASLIAAEAAARGVGFAVLVADDEVAPAQADEHSLSWLSATGGSRAAAPDGSAVAWPWRPDNEKPAHGAIPWSEVDPIDLLSALSLQGNRIVAADTSWVTAAGDPAAWSPAPDALLLEGIADLDLYAGLLDRWMPLSAVGPLTWIEHVGATHGRAGWRPTGAATVDVERALLEGATVATNGPRIVLEVDGQGPGALLDEGGPKNVRVRVEAPHWIPLSGVALIGSGGERLAEWTPGDGVVRLDAVVAIVPGDWLLAVCWGDESASPLLEQPAWAITSPVWTGRP